VGAVLVVVNGHESVAAHPYGIGGGGGVVGAGAAVGLEFVAEVAHVSAGEVEGQVGVDRIGQALVQGLEDGSGFLALGAVGVVYVDGSFGVPVGEYFAGGCSQEGKACWSFGAGAVQPEGVFGVAVQVGEGGLGVDGLGQGQGAHCLGWGGVGGWWCGVGGRRWGCCAWADVVAK